MSSVEMHIDYCEKKIKLIEKEREKYLQRSLELVKEANELDHMDKADEISSVTPMELIDEAIINTEIAGALLSLERKTRLERLKYNRKKYMDLAYGQVRNVFK